MWRTRFLCDGVRFGYVFKVKARGDIYGRGCLYAND